MFGRLLILGFLSLLGFAPARGGEPPTPGQKKEPEKPEVRRDSHGDPLPDGAVARLGTVRFRHNAHVRQVAFSPDGKYLASVGGDDAVRFWDPATGKPLQVLEAPARARGLAFSPDGRTVAACGYEAREVRLWDAATGRHLHTLTGQGGDLDALAFSPDGKLLACESRSSTVCLWDPTTGRELRRLPRNNPSARSLAFSPDGKMLAVGGSYGLLQVLDVATGKELYRAKSRGWSVYGLAFSPDGKALACGLDETVHLLDADTGKELWQFRGHKRNVTALAFSPDGKWVASGEIYHGGVRLLEAATGKEVRTIGADSVTTLAFSPDGRVLAVEAWATVRLWDPRTGKELGPLPGHARKARRIAFAPDGKTLVSMSEDETARLWDLTTGKEVRRFPCWYHAEGAFSPDGRTLAVQREERKTTLWDPATGKEQLTVAGAGPTLFSADGERLLTGLSGRLTFLNPESGKEVHRLTASDSATVKGLAMFPNGRSLATFDESGSRYIWDIGAGKPRLQLPPIQWPEERPACCVAVSPDGRVMAWGRRRCIELWDATTGERLRELSAHGVAKPVGASRSDGDGGGEAYALAFSPDGRSLASVGEDGVVVVWEVATGTKRMALQGHGDGVYGVAFAPDGKTLASCGFEGTVLVWDCLGPRSRRLIAPREDELKRLWEDLADTDAGVAFRAVGRLAGAPREAVPFLKERVRPLAPVDPERMARLLAALDGKDFTARERAGKELEALAEAAGPGLRKALAGRPTAEARRRLEELVRHLEWASPGPELLRQLRAVEALEHAGTGEARALLEDLGRGMPDARLTQDAQATLSRLTKRATKP